MNDVFRDGWVGLPAVEQFFDLKVIKRISHQVLVLHYYRTNIKEFYANHSSKAVFEFELYYRWRSSILMGIVTILFLLVLGWLTGAAINLLADYLPVERKVGHPVCPECQERVDCLKFIFLEDCPHCGAKRSARSQYLQWLVSISFMLVGYWKPERMLAVEALILVGYFSLVFVIDLEHRLILHPISLIGVVIGLAIGFRLHGPVSTILGGVSGFLMMLALYYLGELFARVMAKRRGEPIDEVALGFGDVNLSGVLGLLLGWPGITIGLLVAILAGGLVSAAILVRMMLRKNYQAFTALPYAPFLILAGAILLFRP